MGPSQSKITVPSFLPRNLRALSSTKSDLPLTLDGAQINESGDNTYLDVWSKFLARPDIELVTVVAQNSADIDDATQNSLLSSYTEKYCSSATKHRVFLPNVATAESPVAMMSRRCTGFQSSPLKDYVLQNQNYGPLLRQGCIQLHLLRVVISNNSSSCVDQRSYVFAVSCYASAGAYFEHEIKRSYDAPRWFGSSTPPYPVATPPRTASLSAMMDPVAEATLPEAVQHQLQNRKKFLLVSDIIKSEEQPGSKIDTIDPFLVDNFDGTTTDSSSLTAFEHSFTEDFMELVTALLANEDSALSRHCLNIKRRLVLVDRHDGSTSSSVPGKHVIVTNNFVCTLECLRKIFGKKGETMLSLSRLRLVAAKYYVELFLEAAELGFCIDGSSVIFTVDAEGQVQLFPRRVRPLNHSNVYGEVQSFLRTILVGDEEEQFRVKNNTSTRDGDSDKDSRASLEASSCRVRDDDFNFWRMLERDLREQLPSVDDITALFAGVGAENIANIVKEKQIRAFHFCTPFFLKKMIKEIDVSDVEVPADEKEKAKAVYRTCYQAKK